MARKARAEVEGGFYHVIMNANRRVIELVSERTLYEGPSGSEALIRELGSGLRFFDSLSRAHLYLITDQLVSTQHQVRQETRRLAEKIVEE